MKQLDDFEMKRPKVPIPPELSNDFSKIDPIRRLIQLQKRKSEVMKVIAADLFENYMQFHQAGFTKEQAFQLILAQHSRPLRIK